MVLAPSFFQTYWHIIKHDVYQATLKFFKDSLILPNYNSNILVLISKFIGADRIEHIDQFCFGQF